MVSLEIRWQLELIFVQEKQHAAGKLMRRVEMDDVRVLIDFVFEFAVE